MAKTNNDFEQVAEVAPKKKRYPTRRAGSKHKKPQPISREELENVAAAAGMDPDYQPTFVEVKIKLEDGASIPAYAHDGDLGRDVVCTSVEYDEVNDVYIGHTGIRAETQRGVGCFCLARSGIRKLDAYLANGVGLVETFTYRGEICFSFRPRTPLEVEAYMSAMRSYVGQPLWRRIFKTKKYKTFQEIYDDHLEYHKKNAINYAPYGPGDRMGQLVFLVFPETRLILTNSLSETERGEGGHGSTGK